jgi:hypothetical protein
MCLRISDTPTPARSRGAPGHSGPSRAGIVADRVGSKRTSSTAALYAVSLAFGVACGGAMPLYAVVTPAYFGERVMGTAYGAVFLISCIAMGLGSVRIGLMAAVLGLTLRPPLTSAVPRPSLVAIG